MKVAALLIAVFCTTVQVEAPYLMLGAVIVAIHSCSIIADEQKKK